MLVKKIKIPTITFLFLLSVFRTKSIRKFCSITNISVIPIFGASSKFELSILVSYVITYRRDSSMIVYDILTKAGFF